MTSQYETHDLQGDVFGRLESAVFFDDVAVKCDHPGMIEADVVKLLGTLNKKGGKIGTLVLVMMAEDIVPNPAMPGPQAAAEIAVRVYTDALLNKPPKGTGKSNATIRRRVRRALHLWSPNGQNEVYCAEKCGYLIDGPDGVESYELMFKMNMPDDAESLPWHPRITLAGDLPAVTVTIDQAEGAEIRYTIGGSFPGKTSDLYVAPFILTEPARIRAAAYAGGIGSNITEESIL